jgi:hypothetical protein
VCVAYVVHISASVSALRVVFVRPHHDSKFELSPLCRETILCGD